MAKTFSFEDGLLSDAEPAEATPAVAAPVSTYKPKIFSFEDALIPQEPVPATPEAAAPVQKPEDLVAAAQPEQQPQASIVPAAPAKTTSGLDVSAMPEQFKSGLTGLQQGWYANVGRNNAQILNIMDAIDSGEYVVPEKDVIGYQEMTPEQRAMYKEGFLKTLGTNIQDYQQYKKEQATYARNKTADEVINLADKKDYSGAWKAFKSDPFGVLQQLSVESLPNVLPSIAGGVAGVALKGGLSGIAVGLGTGSFPVEFMGSIAESLAESGVDINDPKAIEEKLRDPKFIEESGKKAVTRGHTIAFTDALSAGVISPLKAGQLLKNIGIAAGNITKEVGLEGTGELLAQTLSGEEIKPGQVIAEMLGAGPQALATTGMSTIAESRKPTETKTAEPETVKTAEQPAPKDQYGYIDTPEYQQAKEKIDEQTSTWEKLKENAAALDKNSPEWSEATDKANNYFIENIRPLYDSLDQIREEWKSEEQPAQKQPEGKEVEDTSFDTKAMEDEIAALEKGWETEKTVPETEPVTEATTEPVASAPAKKTVTKDRNMVLQAAAQQLQRGEITREDYDALVEENKPIRPYEDVPTPTPIDVVQAKINQDKKDLVQPDIAEGTRVGTRLDLPAAGRGAQVVSIHEPRSASKAGPIIGYDNTAVLKDVDFGVGTTEERALKIAGGEGKQALQTMEGSYVKTSPEEAQARAKEAMNDPAWTQVSFDPTRHSYFYDMTTGQPVTGASEVIQIGKFVIAKDVTHGNKENFLFNINRNRGTAYEGQRQRRPSLRKEAAKLIDELHSDVVNPIEVADKLDAALKRSGEPKEVQPRVRGADFIRQKLLEAKRRGDLSEFGVDMAEWFIQQNPMLVDNLGISVRQPNEPGGAVSGFYNPLASIITLMKESGNDETAVHEILHHAERMMPQKVQDAIRRTWMRSMSVAAMKAFRGTDQNLIKYFVNLFEGHVNGDEKALRDANRQLVNGEVDVTENYQYFNPSEFWAVNGSDIVANRYDSMRSVLARLKNWLKEFAEKAKQLMGMDSNAPLIRALDSLSRADGKFVTQDMLHKNGTSFANIPGNYKGKAAPAAAWTAPKKTALTEAAYNFVNEQTYLKRVTETLEKAYQVPANLNAYTKDILKNSRAAFRSKMFHLKEVRPILELMRKYKISDDQLTKYSQAKFAAQRNKQIADRGGVADGGSGMFNKDAADYLANLPASRVAELEQVRQRIKDIITGTQNLYVDSGAETQQTIDSWNTADNSEYVPLNRVDDDYAVGSSGLGGIGYSASGRSTKMATGSTSKDVKSILENVIHQRDVAIERAERIRVGRALYAMAIKYPNPSFWLPISPDAIKNKSVAIAELQQLGLSPTEIHNLMEQPKVARIDSATGKMVYEADATALQADNVLVTKVNGKNRYIVFNKNDPTAMAMVKGLKSMPVEEAGAVLGMIGKLTRFWSSITTQFNPIWGLFVNMVRDVFWMWATLGSTPLKGKKWEMTKKIIPAMIGSWEGLRAERTGKQVTGQWAQTFEESGMAGARTVFRDSWVNAKENGEYLAKEMAKLDQGNVRKAVTSFVNVLEDFNNMLESSIRVAAYDTAIKQGLSKDEAAKISKEITVNFDRRGAKTKYARNLFAFFNAAVQGSAKLVEVLRSPAGKGIMTTMIGIGVMQALMLAMAGLDDKDVPDYEKEKNFIIPTGGKTYKKVPLPQGLSMFVNFGRIPVEMGFDQMNNNGRNMGKKVTSLFSSIGNAFNPFGESSNIFLSIVPTIAKPLASVSVNQDVFGRKIHKESTPGKPSPGYLRTSEKSNPFSQGMAEAINWMTGGGQFKQGAISPTGDDIDYLATQYAGGLGRELKGIYKAGAKAFKGEALDVNEIPVISKYFGTSDRKGAIARNFYDNVNNIAAYAYEHKNLLATDQDLKASKLENKYPEYELNAYGQKLVRSISALNKQHERLSKEKGSASELKAIEADQLELMKEFNAEVDRMQRRRR